MILPTDKSRYLDDFTKGETIDIPPFCLTEDEIITFATQYDPQPIHIDPVEAENGPFGGLIGSGFQTICMGFRKFWDLGFFVGTSMGGPGMGPVRWLKPVRPNQMLHIRYTVIEVRRSKSLPDRGPLTAKVEVFDDQENLLSDWTITAFLKVRPESESSSKI